MSDYNTAPEGLKEIPLEDFTNLMFMYQTMDKQSRQVRGEQTCDLMMFQIPTFDENKIIGIAMMRDWFDQFTGKNRPQTIVRFCKYGKEEDWKEFTQKFAAQFSGDNS